jgi:hypothetical protein
MRTPFLPCRRIYHLLFPSLQTMVQVRFIYIPLVELWLRSTSARAQGEDCYIRPMLEQIPWRCCQRAFYIHDFVQPYIIEIKDMYVSVYMPRCCMLYIYRMFANITVCMVLFSAKVLFSLHTRGKVRHDLARNMIGLYVFVYCNCAPNCCSGY